MEKITLSDKEYELPEIDFGVIRAFARRGFHLVTFAEITQHIEDYLSTAIAVVTDSTLEEADKLLTANISHLGEITDKLVQWVGESDFFKQMQVEATPATKQTQTKRK